MELDELLGLVQAGKLSHVIEPGEELLVDATCYGLDGEVWAPFTRVAVGTASVYPFKVQLPGRGEGQYKASEIKGRRRRKAEVSA